METDTKIISGESTMYIGSGEILTFRSLFIWKIWYLSKKVSVDMVGSFDETAEWMFGDLNWLKC